MIYLIDQRIYTLGILVTIIFSLRYMVWKIHELIYYVNDSMDHKRIELIYKL